jgi:hypothetical protein
VKWADVKGVPVSKLAVKYGMVKARGMKTSPCPSSFEWPGISSTLLVDT